MFHVHRRLSSAGVFAILVLSALAFASCGGDEAAVAEEPLATTGSRAVASATPPAKNAAVDATSRDMAALLAKARADLPLDLVAGNSIGKADAPLQLVTYEDFQCPYCLKFVAEQEPGLIEKYVKPGQLRITYKHLPILGGESARAAIASQCAAEQGHFWQYHNALFAVEAEAGQFGAEKLNVGRFSDASLEAYAGQVGLDAPAFAACLDSGKFDQLLVDQSREAKNLGFTGVPAFSLNGQSLGSGIPADPSAWDQLFDEVLKSKP